VYLAPNPAAAMLEVLVHLLGGDINSIPRSYQLLEVEIPDDLARTERLESQLSGDWVVNVLTTQAWGDDWLAEGRTAIAIVPSVVAPRTTNILLNPRHPDARQVRILSAARYPWDGRLLSPPPALPPPEPQPPGPPQSS